MLHALFTTNGLFITNDNEVTGFIWEGGKFSTRETSFVVPTSVVGLRGERGESFWPVVPLFLHLCSCEMDTDLLCKAFRDLMKCAVWQPDIIANFERIKTCVCKWCLYWVVGLPWSCVLIGSLGKRLSPSFRAVVTWEKCIECLQMHACSKASIFTSETSLEEKKSHGTSSSSVLLRGVVFF